MTINRICSEVPIEFITQIYLANVMCQYRRQVNVNLPGALTINVTMLAGKLSVNVLTLLANNFCTRYTVISKVKTFSFGGDVGSMPHY